MKIEHIDENNIIVFLNKFKMKEKIALSSSYLHDYFKNLFQKLKNNYQIDISGYYSITLYQDNVYGIIMDIKKEFTDYFDYFDNQVDMKIDVNKDHPILYKLDKHSLLDNKVFPYLNFYMYKDEVYGKPKKTINQYLLGNLIENSTIIYGKTSKEIVKLGKKINSKYVFI